MKKLMPICFLLICIVAEASVQLPATLDKSNVSAVSTGMTYYNNDYFILNPNGSQNPTAWAEWSVNLSHPGKYFVTEVGYYTNGHQYQLQLLNGNAVVAEYSTAKNYSTGELTITQSAKWDLSGVSVGDYTIRVKASLAYGEPNLKSITLENDGEILPEPEPMPDPDPNGMQVNYTADNSTIFPNPERGFITMLEKKNVSEQEPYAVVGKEKYLTDHANDDYGSLILVLYYLNNYINTPNLPNKVLNAFDEDMDVLRSHGMKAIVRFAYALKEDSINGDLTAVDAPLSIIEQHIDQYKSHWDANTDVIYVFQMGMVGAYGEWYYTTNFGNKDSHMNSDRRALVDTFLSATPKNRCVQIRTPQYKTEYVGSTTPILYTEAYNGSNKSRLGHHNDAFLYQADNMGTYNDTSIQKPYIARETFYVPIGGESDITKDSMANIYAGYDETIAEMSRLHWTFIQSGYSRTVTDKWRNEGTFDELNRRLGYRYQLVSGTYTQTAETGDSISVYMQIRNAGFAPLYNERPVYIVLKNNSHTYPLLMKADPRRWRPNGVVTTVSEKLKLPADMATGTYQLYLYMPDAYASIATNPKYAVRFANENVWVSSTGMNKLNASIVVSEGSEPPTPSGVELPATLNKANMSAVSDDKWYNTDYFNFGDDWGVDGSDGTNLSRWIEWNVYLGTPGEYTVSEVGYYPNGHNYSLQLLNGNSVVSEYTTIQTWASGEQTITQSTKWDLSGVAVGNYTLRVMNATSNGQPKLKSITLENEALITSHAVTWNANGGSCATATSEVNVGDPIGTLPVASKTGYSFIGWFTATSGGSQIKTTTIPESNVTYYAQYVVIPQLSGNGVELPATLNNVNVGTVSGDMTYYNTEYFDFGDGSSGHNLNRWAAWRVYLHFPGEYTVSEETSCATGHNYILQLFDGNTLVAEYTTAKTYATGEQTITQSTTWNLSSVPAGNYTLRVLNGMANGEPKLKNLILSCELPNYTITWKNYDGSTLKTEQVTYGDTPAYTGATPTRQSSGCTEYTFSGWSPTIVTATGNATYTATFEEITIEYTITVETNDSTKGSVSIEF